MTIQALQRGQSFAWISMSQARRVNRERNHHPTTSADPLFRLPWLEKPSQ